MIPEHTIHLTDASPLLRAHPDCVLVPSQMRVVVMQGPAVTVVQLSHVPDQGVDGRCSLGHELHGDALIVEQIDGLRRTGTGDIPFPMIHHPTGRRGGLDGDLPAPRVRVNPDVGIDSAFADVRDAEPRGLSRNREAALTQCRRKECFFHSDDNLFRPGR